MITIVGMGNGIDDVTVRGRQAIQEAAKVFVRTQNTDCAKTLQTMGVQYTSCDDLYDAAPNFDALQEAICARLLAAKTCVYCADGDGTEDGLIPLLTARAKVRVVAGVSRASGALAASLQVGDRVQSISALALSRDATFLAPQATLVIYEIDDKFLAGDIKLRLLDTYGNIQGYLVRNGHVKAITVADIDRQRTGYGADCMFVLPRREFLQKTRYNFEDVIYLLQRLRAPDGCEWDKVQTHQSIRDCCIEEAYELVEAIDLQDVDKMVEETGDVLLQAVFHASMATDAGEYTVSDVLSALCTKLIGRHPHVFGNVHASTPEEALAAWDSAKAVEKKQVTYSQKMQDVAPMSALMRSKKIQKIAAKAHYDFDSVEQAATKIDEELQELLRAATEEERTLEGGDLLFAAVNVLRLMHIEPELALLQSTRKFMQRFALVEQALAAEGKRIDEVSTDELWRVYDRIKGKKA